ncbi:hypothetical protein BJF78_08175 [Pseudonocardia sp. CNS-139]|nr:hypothetical protein BJF78_08175 [Pseudonocardia sp. CNS-139]
MLEAGLSWRWIFGVTFALGIVGIALTLFALPETHPRWIGGRAYDNPADAETAGAEGPARQPNLWQVLCRRHVLTSALVLGFAGAAMIAHLAGLSFFLQNERGLGPAGYSAVFAADAAGMIIANNVNRMLLRRWSAQTLLSVSVPTMLGLAVVFAILLRAEAPLAAVLPSLFMLISCWGFVMPNAIAVGMSVERSAGGRASAILGVSQFGFSVISAPAVGSVPVLLGVPPMASVIVVCLALAVLVQLAARFRLPQADPAGTDMDADAEPKPACPAAPA